MNSKSTTYEDGCGISRNADDSVIEKLACGDIFRLTLPNDIASLYVAESLIEAVCRNARATDLVSNGITLAVSEALCNVIRYGYPEGHGQLGEIGVVCHLVDNQLTVTLIDDGIVVPDKVLVRYREGVVTMPTVDLSIDDLPESSWGVGLMLTATSVIRHRRENHINYLEMVFPM